MARKMLVCRRCEPQVYLADQDQFNLHAEMVHDRLRRAKLFGGQNNVAQDEDDQSDCSSDDYRREISSVIQIAVAMGMHEGIKNGFPNYYQPPKPIMSERELAEQKLAEQPKITVENIPLQYEQEGYDRIQHLYEEELGDCFQILDKLMKLPLQFKKKREEKPQYKLDEEKFKEFVKACERDVYKMFMTEPYSVSRRGQCQALTRRIADRLDNAIEHLCIKIEEKPDRD